MTSSAAFASPSYPARVGSQLVVALAKALSGRPDGGPEPFRRAESEKDAADNAKRIAVALRDTCRIVAAELAGRKAERVPPVAERLTATASQIGDVLALFDRTTEQMHRMAVDALEAAPGPGVIEDGLTVVASEVETLSRETRRASERVARQVEAIREGSDASIVSAERGSETRHAVEMDWSGPNGPRVKLEPAGPATPSTEKDGFCLMNWLARGAESRG